MLTGADYALAVDELAQFCGIHTCRLGIVAVYLAGSVARGDFVPGRSDIDIYVVVDDGFAAMAEEAIQGEAKKIASERLKELLDVHPEPIGVTVTTMGEVREGTSFLGAGFEYRNFMTTARLLLGRDVKPLIPASTREEERSAAQKALAPLAKLFASSDLEAASRLACGLDGALYGAFSLIFRTACIALSGEGTSVGGKCEAVEAFSRVYPNEVDLQSFLAQCLELWDMWAKRSLTGEEVEWLGDACRKFVPRVLRLWEVPIGGGGRPSGLDPGGLPAPEPGR